MTNDAARPAFHVATSGPDTAPAIVLHHPLATDLSCWDDLAARLETDYRVLRFDARGHGQTPPTPAPYDFGMLARDVIAVMDAAGLARAQFLGLSMGGMVGQALGLHHADRFSSLTLVSTTSAIPSSARQMWHDRIASARADGMDATVDAALARWVTDASLARDPGLRDRLISYMQGTPVEGYVGWCSAIADLDMTEQLSAISLPTHVVVGSEDPATPPAAAQIIHRRIGGSEYTEVPGVSHMLQLEAPAAFHDAVRPFLDQHRDGAAAGEADAH